MAYVIDGNLYFQDGSKPPVQLTESREYRHPIGFSENGEKIFFFGGNTNNLYSINVDGSHAQALATNDLLQSTNSAYDESTTFCEPILVPHSPFVLFRTCSHPDGNTTIYQDDLFIVDTDTKQVGNLLPRGQGGGYYYPSPDGSMLAIDKVDSIDILGIDGRMIHRNLATYTLSEPVPLAARVYWLSDSSALILALPINTYYDTAPPLTYAIWRYSLDTGTGVQLSLDPPPMGYAPVWVSPDGNWITYTNHDERSSYLGDLRQGRTQSYEPEEPIEPCEWSPDSVHFVYRAYQPDKTGLYLASVNDPPIFIGEGEFVAWLDANRFVYYNFTDHAYGLKDNTGESVPILIGGTTWKLRSYDSIVFTYQPPSN